MKQPTLRARLTDAIVLSIFGAMLVISQVALSFLPNIELVSTLIIILTMVYGKKAFCPIYIFVAAEGLLFGFGLWWICYLYVWAVLAVTVLALRKIKSCVFWAIVSAIFGLLFGTLCSIPTFIVMGFSGGVAYIISGISFDLIHCAGNFIVTLTLFKPLYSVLAVLDGRVKNHFSPKIS